MNKIDVLMELSTIEKKFSIKFPDKYKNFLSAEVLDAEAYEVQTVTGDTLVVFNCIDVIERNEIYEVRQYVPNYFLIGQDGDLGYFINLKSGSDDVYSLDLGALGSLNMDNVAEDIYKLRA